MENEEGRAPKKKEASEETKCVCDSHEIYVRPVLYLPLFNPNLSLPLYLTYLVLICRFILLGKYVLIYRSSYCDPLSPFLSSLSLPLPRVVWPPPSSSSGIFYIYNTHN